MRSRPIAGTWTDHRPRLLPQEIDQRSRTHRWNPRAHARASGWPTRSGPHSSDHLPSCRFQRERTAGKLIGAKCTIMPSDRCRHEAASGQYSDPSIVSERTLMHDRFRRERIKANVVLHHRCHRRQCAQYVSVATFGSIAKLAASVSMPVGMS